MRFSLKGSSHTGPNILLRNVAVFEALVPLPSSMATSLLALPRSCHDLGKDTMAMQDRAKANHD